MTLDADLAKLTLDELQVRLAAHAIERPAALDPGFAKWMEIRDAIRFHKDVKLGEVRVAWKDVTTGQLAPPPPPIPVFKRTTPTPTAPTPAKEIPMAKKAADMTPAELEKKRAYQRDWHAKKAATKPTPKAKSKAQLAPKPKAEPVFKLATQSEDTLSQIKGIRRQVWQLMAHLEGLSAAQLLELGSDLALLDAAAHAANQLATGRLEVA